MFARRREELELVALFDRLVEFVTGRGGGDDLRSFKAGQPLVTPFLLFGEVFPTVHSWSLPTETSSPPDI